jgi:DNA-binding transcriptional MerR regulator
MSANKNASKAVESSEKEQTTGNSVTEQSQAPLDRYSDRLNEVIRRCGAQGSLLECGIESAEDTKVKAKKNKKRKREYTEEEVSQLRHIIVTKRREKYLNKMEKLISGVDTGTTAFSMYVFPIVPKEIAKMKRYATVSEQLDHLLALTDALASEYHDTWMHDHEDCKEVQKVFQSISKYWKLLLAKSDEELEIDAEFTRKGLEHKAEKWNASAKEHVEDEDHRDNF